MVSKMVLYTASASDTYQVLTQSLVKIISQILLLKDSVIVGYYCDNVIK